MKKKSLSIVTLAVSFAASTCFADEGKFNIGVNTGVYSACIASANDSTITDNTGDTANVSYKPELALSSVLGYEISNGLSWKTS